MTEGGAPAKWRPTLGLVVLAMLATVAALPLLGLSFVRLHENQLVRQTEGELIAQSAVVAALVAREIETDPARDRFLGAPAPDAELGVIEPGLDSPPIQASGGALPLPSRPNRRIRRPRSWRPGSPRCSRGRRRRRWPASGSPTATAP